MDEGKIVTVGVMVTVFILFAAIGFVSTKYLGDDNPVEEVAEEVMEDIAEAELSLPPNSLEGKIDLSPEKKENNSSSAG